MSQMVFQIVAPEGFTIAEALIPVDLWKAMVEGRVTEIIFPMDVGPTPRMVIIKEAAK